MDKEPTRGKNTLSTQEWYDFIALVANLAPGIHAGDKTATKRLLEMLGIDSGKHVLDVGSGSGITAGLIVNEFGARVTGIDISPKMVEKARERAQKTGISDRTHFQVESVLDLPFDNSSFDAVIFESLLTILPGDPATALSEMVRVVRPGGKIGGNEATIDLKALPELESLLEGHPAIQRTYSPTTLRDQFEAAGLKDIQMDIEDASQAPALDMSSALREIGCGGLLSFFISSYPKLAWKLITDTRFRQARRIDEQVTSLSKEYMGYALIVGQKPE
jgi:SAM-dependent methyltransferase